MSSRSRTLLDQVISDLDQVLADDALAGLTEPERREVLAVAGAAFRRIEAVIVETVATGDVEFPHSAGCRSENELLRRALLVDTTDATHLGKVADLVRRQTNLLSGERLPARWPAMRTALLDGVVGIAGVLAATAPMEQVRDRIGLDERLRADELLADAARGARDDAHAGRADAGGSDGARAATDAGRSSERGPAPMPEDLRLLAEALAAIFDPDGAEPADEAARRRGITVGRLRNGLRTISGALTPDVAAQLELIFDAQNNPKGDGPPRLGVRFSPTEAGGSGADGSDVGGPDAGGSGGSGADVGGSGVGGSDVGELDPFNSDPRAVIDDRTAMQKRHDALAAALGIAARHRDMPSLGGAAPTSSSPSTRRISQQGAAGRAHRAQRVSCPSGSPHTSGARARSSASPWTRAGSSGSTARTACSLCTNDERSSHATRNA
ncbi:DUF222 domain-containing protein [Microbacterium sp. LS_15]|uniref:hypothetical protein n=1 Tax=Microbacterium sp. LS_15 TaxID=3055790 RepID=UPI0035BFE24E